MAAVLNCFFDSTSHHMAKSGINLSMKGGDSLLAFMTFGVFLADEAALHAAFCCKGASGLKPCFLCQNIFNYNEVRAIVDRDPTGFCQHHVCTDPAKFVLHTADTINAILRRLHAASTTVSQADFYELQTRLGWNLVPGGVMWHPTFDRGLVDPTIHTCFDWMHIFFVSGVFNNHVGLLMWNLKPHNITMKMINDYVQEFHWPAAVGTNTGADAFAGKRARSSWDACSLRVTASEGLSLLPVLAMFAHSLLDSPNGTVRMHADVFLRLALVVELIRRSARGTVPHGELRAAITNYVQGFHHIYGPENMIIKFHMAMHLPAFLQRFGILPNCFALERKHKWPKRFANELRNLNGNWDSYVLREITAKRVTDFKYLPHFGSVSSACLVEGGIPSTRFLAKLSEVMYWDPASTTITSAKTARVNEFECCSKSDIVVFRGAEGLAIGRVEFHVCGVRGGEMQMLSLLQHWPISARTSRAWKCTKSANRLLCPTDDIWATAIWAGEACEIATVCKPAHLSFE